MNESPGAVWHPAGRWPSQQARKPSTSARIDPASTFQDSGTEETPAGVAPGQREMTGIHPEDPAGLVTVKR
jgi:hypothetical protein